VPPLRPGPRHPHHAFIVETVILRRSAAPVRAIHIMPS
jgi:hypothetical protein